MNKKLQKRIAVQKIASQAIVDKQFHCYINVAPRVGKTKIALDALKQLPVSKPVLITIPYAPVKESWKKEIKKWGCDHKVKIINQRSLDKQNMSDYLVVIADEIHQLSEKQIDALKKANCVVGLSGSMAYRTKEKLYFELNLSSAFNYSLEKAIEDELISDYKIIIHYVRLEDTLKTVKAGNKNNQFMQTEQDAYDYWSNRFNQAKIMKEYKNMKFLALKRAEIIYNSMHKLKLVKEFRNYLKEDTGKRALFFTPRTSIADKIGYSHHSKSKADNLSKFLNEEIQFLSVCELVNMGMTFPNLKIGVFHQLKSNQESAVQKVLRMCNYEDGVTAVIHIVCVKHTQDEVWLDNAIKLFNREKVFVNETY